MSKYTFTSKRIKKFSPKPTQPDYHNIINLNGVLFTLTGYLNSGSSDIKYTLEKITQERLKGNRFLIEELNEYKKMKL